MILFFNFKNNYILSYSFRLANWVWFQGKLFGLWENTHPFMHPLAFCWDKNQNFRKPNHHSFSSIRYWGRDICLKQIIVCIEFKIFVRRVAWIIIIRHILIDSVSWLHLKMCLFLKTLLIWKDLFRFYWSMCFCLGKLH